MIGDYLETYTFEYLMNKALSNVPDNLDKREGSVIYDALAPACYQLAEFYLNLRKLLDDTFISTSTGEYLDYKVAEQGLTRYPATHAIRKGVFTFTGNNVPDLVGERFSTLDGDNSVNFTVAHQLEAGSYELICEEVGSIGNEYVGILQAITNISGLQSAQLVAEDITPARDEETDEELRARYLLTVKQKPFGGNIAQYDELIRNINGVAEVQIYPVWNGPGTVKCSIISTDNYTPADPGFVQQVQTQIDPRQDGSGVGMAPIGHTVTIAAPTAKEINVSATVQISTAHTLSQLRQNIEDAIKSYILELRKSWGVADELGQYRLSVNISKITMAILSVPNVEDVSNVRINGSTTNLSLVQTGQTQEIPILGTVTLNG